MIDIDGVGVVCYCYHSRRPVVCYDPTLSPLTSGRLRICGAFREKHSRQREERSWEDGSGQRAGRYFISLQNTNSFREAHRIGGYDRPRIVGRRFSSNTETQPGNATTAYLFFVPWTTAMFAVRVSGKLVLD